MGEGAAEVTVGLNAVWGREDPHAITTTANATAAQILTAGVETPT